jgi:catechol 2,3-dioxygenase-like lactoylglutathione lyase family enzyme
MIEWYASVLGFELEKRWVVVELPGRELAYLIHANGFRLEFISGGSGPRAATGATFEQHLGVRGANHVAFWTEDVDASVARIAAHGVEPFFPPTDFELGAERRVAFFKDPEGNVLEFAGPLKGPRS